MATLHESEPATPTSTAIDGNNNNSIERSKRASRHTEQQSSGNEHEHRYIQYAFLYSFSQLANCAHFIRCNLRQVKKTLTLSERFGLLRKGYKPQSPAPTAPPAAASRRVEILLVGKRHYEVTVEQS